MDTTRIYTTVGPLQLQGSVIHTASRERTYLESVSLKDVHLAHWTAPLFDEPWVHTRLMKHMSATTMYSVARLINC